MPPSSIQTFVNYSYCIDHLLKEINVTLNFEHNDVDDDYDDDDDDDIDCVDDEDDVGGGGGDDDDDDDDRGGDDNNGSNIIILTRIHVRDILSQKFALKLIIGVRILQYITSNESHHILS